MPLRPSYRKRLALMTTEEKVESLIGVVRALEATVLALLMAMLLGGYVVWGIVDTRQSRVDYVDGQFKKLYCLLVGGQPNDPKKPLIKKIRDDYHCGPFDPKKAQQQYGSSAPTKTPQAGASPTPTPGTSPGAVNVPDPSPRVTTVVNGRTVVVTRTVTKRGRTVTRTASGQKPNPLSPILCPLPVPMPTGWPLPLPTCS